MTFKPSEYVVCSFWRRNNGVEEMHVYTGYGSGDVGRNRAIAARYDMLMDYRANNPTGPTPVVKVVKTTPMEAEVWNRAQSPSSATQSQAVRT